MKFHLKTDIDDSRLLWKLGIEEFLLCPRRLCCTSSHPAPFKGNLINWNNQICSLFPSFQCSIKCFHKFNVTFFIYPFFISMHKESEHLISININQQNSKYCREVTDDETKDAFLLPYAYSTLPLYDHVAKDEVIAHPLHQNSNVSELYANSSFKFKKKVLSS